MLVTITQIFDESGHRWFVGDNPDVSVDIARRWIADGKAVLANPPQVSPVPGVGIPISENALASTTGATGTLYELTDGESKGAKLTWATPAGASSPTWCWWLWPQSAFGG